MASADLGSWRAWYTGDRVFDGSTEAEFDELPANGFLVAMRRVPGGREQLSGGDWYWSIDGVWYRVPTHPEPGKRNPPPSDVDAWKVKRGDMVDDATWDRVIADAMSW